MQLIVVERQFFWFSVQDQLYVFMDGRVGSGAAYRMIFSKRYACDALRGLTVGLE